MKRLDSFETDRLILRQWQEGDKAAFAKLNADPEVMRFFEKPLTEVESNDLADKVQAQLTKEGFGFWAVEEKSTGSFIGITGINRPGTPTHFSPCIEIGWRLALDAWGKGYATEAAKETLNKSFGFFELDEIVSFTAVNNMPSRRVMEKIGMMYDPEDDFDHPSLPDGSPLKRHVLYRVKNSRP